MAEKIKAYRIAPVYAARLCRPAGDVARIGMTKILLVEDDQEGADAVRQFLEFRGFQVTMVQTGEAAIDEFFGALARAPFDVVIADLHLPGISGDELAQRLAGAPRRPKLIGLSGDQEPRAPRLPKLFDVWLRKPCRPKLLVETIGRLLQPAGYRG
jgi:CheY-like chemotaxis protein